MHVPQPDQPCAEEGIRGHGRARKRAASTAISPGDPPIMIGSLVLHIVVQPALVFPWKPISNLASLFYFLFSRSTNLQSAMTCAKLATALEVLSVPLHMWKVSTQCPAASFSATTIVRRTFYSSGAGFEDGGAQRHGGAPGVGPAVRQALQSSEWPCLQAF